MAEKDVATLQALGRGKQPEPTLTDAIRLYLKDKVEGTADETKRQRVERVKGHVEKGVGPGPKDKIADADRCPRGQGPHAS